MYAVALHKFLLVQPLAHVYQPTLILLSYLADDGHDVFLDNLVINTVVALNHIGGHQRIGQVYLGARR